jgi:DNA-binding LacI/PurR family transcriptional regulator
MPAPTRSSTIRDVAALAGVSVAAVSRFVNGKQRFTPEVEARIQAAVTQVGYRSNPAARSIRTGRSGAVAALVCGVERPHTAALLKGISRVALQKAYDLLIVDTAHCESPARELQRLLGMQVDGLLITTAMPAGTAELLVRYGRPFVDLTRAAPTAAGQPGEHPMAAAAEAGALLGRYLVRSGHKRLVYLGCDSDDGNTAQWHGLQEALRGSATSLHVQAVAASAANSATHSAADAGAALASSLFLALNPPDAVVTGNDMLALGLLGEAQRLGVRVPDEVSVASIGNMPMAAFLTPALTSVELHGDDSGAQAMANLLAAISGLAEPATSHPPQSPRLIVRESTRQR